MRGGKGLAGIHAASDSYHGEQPAGGTGAADGGGRRTGRAARDAADRRQADKNADQKLSKDEFAALADAWFDKVDPDKPARSHRRTSRTRFARGASRAPPAPRRGGRGRPVRRSNQSARGPSSTR